MQITNKKTKTICILFLFAISLAYWIITPIGVDMQFHILRIGELGKELARGTAFPVYMYRDVYSHYGYPLPIFYCSLFLYPFAALVALGMQAITAYKLMIIVCVWVVMAVSYVCIGKLPGYEEYRFTGAFLYTVQPFFLNELFVRASIGAACVFIFIPLVLLGLYYILYTSRIKGVLMLGGGMSGIVSSHVVSTVLIVIALTVVYVCAVISRIRTGHRDSCAPLNCREAGFKYLMGTMLDVLVSAVICLALTAWYVFPVLEQLLNYEFKGQIVTSLQIEGENPLAILIPMHLLTAVSHMTHRYLGLSEIGGVSVPILIYTAYLFVTRRIMNVNKSSRMLLRFYYIMYLMLFVKPLWHLLGSTLGFMQFTWRVYIIITIVGFVFCLITLKPAQGENTDVHSGTEKVQIIIAVVSAVYILMFFFGYYAVRNLMPSFIESRAGHIVSTYEYSSETEDILYIPTCLDEQILSKRPRTVAIDDYIINEGAGTVTLSLDEAISEDRVIELPFIMYNGYRAVNTDTGELYVVFPSEEGLVAVRIPGDVTGHITVSYTGTIIQRVTFLISLAAFIIYIGGSIFIHQKIC